MSRFFPVHNCIIVMFHYGDYTTDDGNAGALFQKIRRRDQNTSKAHRSTMAGLTARCSVHTACDRALYHNHTDSRLQKRSTFPTPWDKTSATGVPTAWNIPNKNALPVISSHSFLTRPQEFRARYAKNLRQVVGGSHGRAYQSGHDKPYCLTGACAVHLVYTESRPQSLQRTATPRTVNIKSQKPLPKITDLVDLSKRAHCVVYLEDVRRG